MPISNEYTRVAQRYKNGTLGGLDKAGRKGEQAKLERHSAAGTVKG